MVQYIQATLLITEQRSVCKTKKQKQIVHSQEGISPALAENSQCVDSL